MSDSAPRPLLPYITQASTPSSVYSERREPQRNYVFVDEQNRQRRLKVVRACDGCRKRKIKCDSANTNTWPCSACQRLRMPCVPPSSSFEADESTDTDRVGQSTFQVQFTTSRREEITNVQSLYTPPPQTCTPQFYNATLIPQQTQSYPPTLFQQPSHTTTTLVSPPNAPRYAPIPFGISNEEPSQTYQATSQHYTRVNSPGSVHETEVPTIESGDGGHLIEAFGNLKISNDAIAEYIVAQRELSTIPVLQDDLIQLPKQPGSDLTVRVPSEWMPDESLAMQYFDYFFEHIHSYVPVLNSVTFYRSWATSKQSISPIILEAVFACAAFAMNRPGDGNRWLALASRHEESFKEAPRLSTLQGMLILLKARETTPKPGYYYRSWMTIVHLIAMAKDLELDQHFEIHREGRTCSTSSLDECATKTRVWNMLFAVELLVGGPQGRTRYSVDLDTVDTDDIVPLTGLDAKEIRISKNHVHFLRCIKNVRRSSYLYARLKKQKMNWATDMEFVEHNRNFDRWLEELPSSLQIEYPLDGSAPRVNFHFVANLHTYHNMSIMVHYRPQLEQVPQSPDGVWKQRMDECYTAAKNICKLQEGLMQNCGLEALLHMLRGINFHIYAILAAVNIHLVALTSPDQNLNHDAPEYFSRHMRLLECCSSAWPMPEISSQIQSLRLAFSADINKPFEVKSGMIYGSPDRSDSISSSPNEPSYDQQLHDQSRIQSPYNSYPVTSPPVGGIIPQGEYVPAPPYMSRGPSHFSYNDSAHPVMTPQPVWNPSRIFESWNTAFGPTAVVQTTPSASAESPGPSYVSYRPPEASFSNYNNFGVPEIPNYIPQMQTQPSDLTFAPQYQQQQQQTPQSFVTPETWQEAVASSFISTKRRWQGDHRHGHREGNEHGTENKTKRPR